MKKIFTLILLSMIAFNTIHAEVTWNLSDDGTLTISGTDMPDYTYYGSNSSAPWFSQRDKIKKVVIKNGVTNIGDNAFRRCYCLTSVSIPNSVTNIDRYAFSECTGLTSIIIPNSVTNIDNDAFHSCSSLTSVTIPNSVTRIGDGVFSGCSGLTSITIPNSVTSIGISAFSGCSGLTSITIPNSVRGIQRSVFSGCSGLTSIIVEEGNARFDSRNNCNAIIEKGSNTLIAGCKNTIIPNSVTSIGISAFSGCSGLTSITIPETVTSIGECAFWGCSGLTSITCEASNPPYCELDCFFYNTDNQRSIPLYVPANSIDAYKKANEWKYFTNIQAIVNAETYTVTLDHNKGVGDPEQITVTYNQPMPENIGLVAPTKTGYEFTGYSKNGVFYYDANMKSIHNFDIQQNCTLYANWKARTTTVTLDPQGGQNATIKVTATYGKAMPTGENIVTPTRAGYTFGGYFTSANGKGTQYYNADMTSTRSWYKDVAEITLYAKWTPDVFVTGIALSEATTDLWIGKTKTLTATVAPTNATITAVTWTSSNTAVATVSSKGLIKGIAKGTATITCKATDGSGISKTCTVTVKQPVTSIALSETEATLWVGKTKKLTATVDPTTASKTTVNWSSSDNNVATVSKYGTITAIGKGNCTIICEAADGYGTKAVCDVTVKQQVTSVNFGYETLTVTCGTTRTLTPKIYPSNADIQTLTWRSKNTSIAKVSSEGVLTAVAPGTAEIICTATDGFKKADTITVEVVPLKITDSKPAIAEGTYGIGGIVYTRTLTEGKYAAFCMPYNVNLNDYTDEFSKVYVPMGMAFLKPTGTLMVMFKKVSLTETIRAGKPFVALAAKSRAVAITNDYKKTFTALTNPEPTNLTVYNWSGSNGFLDFNPDVEVKIGGTYTKLTELDNEKYYSVSTSGTMSKATTVSPYRIYAYKDDNNSNAKVTEIIFSFDEDEMATGIEDIANEQKGDDKYYNLNGQRINKSNAQKGIYIINGKKYAK